MAVPFWDLAASDSDFSILKSQPGVLDPNDHPVGNDGPVYMENPWEQVTLNGIPVPGLVSVHGLPQFKIDMKPKAGRDSATITGTGYMPGPIDIDVLIWTNDQWRFFVALVPQIWRKPTKKTKVGELAISISHPGCDLWGITQVIVQGVSIPEPGPYPQSKLIKIKCLEYVKDDGADKTKTAKPAPQFPTLDPRHPVSNAPEKPSASVPGPG